MTVRRSDHGTILLEGICAVEDAEPLLQMLHATPNAVIDWTQSQQLHTAVLQVIFVSGCLVVGPCGDDWLEQWVAPQLFQTGTTA